MLAYRTDDVILDADTHSVRSGFWHFDLETGEISTVFDKANVKTPEEWWRSFSQVDGKLRHRSY